MAHMREILRTGVVSALVIAAFAATGCDKKSNPTAPIVVPPLDSIRITPDTLRVRVGAIGAFVVVGTDTAGAPFRGVPVSWTTDDSLHAVVSINSQGQVLGVSEGFVHVIATFDSLRDSAVVVVEPQGNGWFAQTSNVTATLHGVFFLANGSKGWAVGDAGKIVRTADGGSHWTLAASGSSASLQSVWFTSASNGWAVGATGTVLRTRDGGTSWQRMTSGASDQLDDVCFANDSIGWAVGGSGLVLKTRDRGLTWTRQNVTLLALHSVSFADTSNGWAVGESGTIVGTHSGGASWFKVTNVTSVALHGVWRRSEPVAFAVGEQGVTPRTRSAPDTTHWELGNSGFSNQLMGVSFPTDQTGYAVGYRDVGLVLRTDNGTDNAGVSWRTQVSNTQYRLNDVFFIDTLHGWAVGSNGTILHTATGGE